MMACAAGILGILAFLDVHEIPLPQEDATCFVAASDSDGTADLFVLAGRRLTVYEDAGADAPRELTLPEGTTAFDVADLEKDGLGELLCVCGKTLLALRLDRTEEGFRTLFELETQFAGGASQPFPHVLVAERDGVPLLVLPCEKALELRTAAGELVESHPIGIDAPRHAAYGRPFSSAVVNPPEAGPANALEMQITRVIAYKPDLPPGVLPLRTEGPLFRRGTPRQLREAPATNPEGWPWFPLQQGGNTRARAYYAVSGEGFGNTLIRVLPPPRTPDGATRTPELGPPRRYPGMAFVPPLDLPDFNGDGYVDLLLWKAPEPAPTVDSLARAAMHRSWPLRLTTHLYVPKNRRFAARPAGMIALDAPLLWYLTASSGAPLRHAALCDFDGNGRSDVGLALENDVYAVWRSEDAGFGDQPSFKRRFREPIRKVVLRADLAGDGRTCVVLRSASYLFVLKAGTHLSN